MTLADALRSSPKLKPARKTNPNYFRDRLAEIKAMKRERPFQGLER